MRPALTLQDVRAADEASVRAGVPVAVLMERAGAAVAHHAIGLLGSAYGRRIVVIAGSGNNGGDGYVAARRLAARGAAVEVVAPRGSPTSGAAREAATRWSGSVRAAGDAPRVFAQADLIIDALFGVGLTRPIAGSLAELVEATASARAAGARVLAVDVPSGVDATTGQVLGAAVAADATVTFVGPKLGALFEPARSLAGTVHVADIGVAAVRATANVLEARDVAAWWPWRSAADHKRLAGRLLVVAGSRSMPGAAILATRAAVRAGAGLTTVFTPSVLAKTIAAAVPEATTIPAPASPRGTLDGASLDVLPADLDADALVIGPGLARDVETMGAVATLLEGFAGPAVVDADALHALASASRPPGSTTIVTPHAGEWRAMLGKDADPDLDRLASARLLHEHLAAILGADRHVVVVLKGPGTVVLDAEAVFVDDLGSAVLAQGGSGDVLAGIIGALCAQTARRADRPGPARFAALGVWLQGAAAARLEVTHPSGASQVIEHIPQVLKELRA